VKKWPSGRGGEQGISGVVGLILTAVSLALVLVLALIGLGTFSGSGGSGSGSTGILSRSNAEQQIKLCAEGRDSSYGDPPSQAQQAACLDDIASQAGGGGGSPAIVPTSTVPGYSVPSFPAN